MEPGTLILRRHGFADAPERKFAGFLMEKEIEFLEGKVLPGVAALTGKQSNT